MDLTFLGGAREVGASCTLLTVAGHRLLIDGGMRPAAREGQPRLPDLSLLDTAPPEALLITHAHIDHTGALPLVASLYPHIPIYATESTRVLTELLLRDSVRIMAQEGLTPDGETPLYTAAQVDALLGRIQPVAFAQPFAPIASASEMTVRFLHAGHILGAAMLYFETPEGTLLLTGDISVTDQRTIKGLDLAALPHAEVMVCEGTYGNRSHGSRREEERRLAETVQGVLARGGRVLLPAFAVGRSQEITLILKAFRASGQLSPVNVYLDGMVRAVCTAYQVQSHDLHPNLQRFLTNARRPLFADPDLHIYAVRSQDRPALVAHSDPSIVISSSGMLSGGASPLYAAALAAHEQDAIIFSGYQDEESPGAALLKARQGNTLRLGEQEVTLACQVARYNLSGHADAEQIAHVVARVRPERLVLVHGASDALEALARRFPKITVDIPASGETIHLPSSHCRETGHARASTTQTVSAAPGQGPAGGEPARLLPTIRALWQMARERGPQRPWTAVELGQHFYEPQYTPDKRSVIEQILKEASVYFKIGRVGAQPTYLPRAAEDVEQLSPIAELRAGEIVLAQGQKGSPPLVALLLSTSEEGTALLVGDQWKAGRRPLKVIRLVPGIRREEWLELPPAEARQQLQQWRAALEQGWIDLFALWKAQQGQPFTFASLCATLDTDDLKLAWGLELLTHGTQLFQEEGATWLPLDEATVRANAGFAHHLDVLEAGAGTRVCVSGKQGILTGHSSWRLFEVHWSEEGIAAGERGEETARVRASNIEIVV